MEPVQSLNLNRRYISGLEPETPVTRAYRGRNMKFTITNSYLSLHEQLVGLNSVQSFHYTEYCSVKLRLEILVYIHYSKFQRRSTRG
jgi:hypothetical protein